MTSHQKANKRLLLKDLFNSTFYDSHKRGGSFEHKLKSKSIENGYVQKPLAQLNLKNRNWIEECSYPMHFKKVLMIENNKMVSFTYI